MTESLQKPDAPENADAVLSRVHRKVLERIAQASTDQHLTIAGDAGHWQPFLEGVECKVLKEDGVSMSYLLRLQPGAVIPSHRHSQDEECVVLEGALRIGGQLVVAAGGYHVAKAGVLHAPISTEIGALIFLRGEILSPSQFL
ncbi:MAG: cupin domain-containing protein [Ramlibacter sp.]